MDRLIIVSVDSHAQAPPEVWPRYVERKYHEFLPALREDNDVYTTVMGTMSYPMSWSPEALSVYDTRGRPGERWVSGHLGCRGPAP